MKWFKEEQEQEEEQEEEEEEEEIMIMKKSKEIARKLSRTRNAVWMKWFFRRVER